MFKVEIVTQSHKKVQFPGENIRLKPKYFHEKLSLQKVNIA